MKIQFFKYSNMLKSTFHKSFWSYSAVFFKKVFFKRTTVYAYSYRYVLFFCHINNGFNSFFASYVAWIYTHFVYALIHNFKCKTVVKMNVCHKRY